MFIYYVLALEILCFLVSLLIYLRKRIPNYLRLFPIFLFITCVVEAIGTAIRDKSLAGMPMYNYFTVLEFVFYYYILYQIILNKTVKKIVIVAAVTYPVFATLYILNQDIYIFHSLSFMLGAFITVGLCIFHLYELFSIPDLKATLNNPTLWICLGLLLFYSCIIPFIGAYNWINWLIGIEKTVHSLTLSILNYILYSSFIIAFLCFLKTAKRKEYAAIS